MADGKSGETWSQINQQERTLYEILFYSQGPLDGYLLGEDARDLLVQSGLPLPVLSKIWSLADVTNDNALSVHEFVLAMHLVRGVLSGQSLPATLPRNLTPPNTVKLKLTAMLKTDKDEYRRLFQLLEVSGSGFVDSQTMAEMLLATRLPRETLALIWDLSDYGRRGKLSLEEFAIACHLLRYAMLGGSLNGPIDIFQFAPNLVSPVSLMARKQRVAEYEEHKQRLMVLKERRRLQAHRESQRLHLAKERVQCLQELFELFGENTEAEKLLSDAILKHKAENEKQEEVVLRLKKVHEEVRQETVKMILEDHKYHDDISRIKKATDELNKRLQSAGHHDNRDTDPFQKLLEPRKGSTTAELNKVNIFTPFKFSPFDVNVNPDTWPAGFKILDEENSRNPGEAIQRAIADLKLFGEEVLNGGGGTASVQQHDMRELWEDEVFIELPDSSDTIWEDVDVSLHPVLAGLTYKRADQLLQILSDLGHKLKTFNSEGGRLVFRNSEDYSSRKKSLQQENADADHSRRRFGMQKQRSKSAGYSSMRESIDSYSYPGSTREGSGKDETNREVRERGLRGQSVCFDGVHLNQVPAAKHKERQLMRSDPMSSLIHSSTSIPRSPEYVGSRCPANEKLLDRASFNKDQTPLRTGDSNILTLRSSRRKDGLSLDLASIALGRAIYVEPIPAHVSSERAKQTSLTSTDKLRNKTSAAPRAPTFTETEHTRQESRTPSIPASTEEAVGLRQNSTKTFSDSNKASPASKTTNPKHAPHDGISAHRSRSQDEDPTWNVSLSSNEEKVQVKRKITSTQSVLNEEASLNATPMLPIKSENPRNSQINREIEHPPQRPPRRAKRQISSEISTDQSPQETLCHPPDPPMSARATPGKINQTNSQHLTGPGTHESTSSCHGDELADDKADQMEPSVKRDNPGVTKRGNLARQFSIEQSEASKVVLDCSRFPPEHKNSLEPNNSLNNIKRDILNHELTKTNNDSRLEVNSRQDPVVGRNERVFTERHIKKTQGQIVKHRPSSLEIQDISAASKVHSFHQLRGDDRIGTQARETNTSNRDPSFEEENAPPMLPLSSPPMLPLSSPPTIPSRSPPGGTEVHWQPVINHTTKDYDVPHRKKPSWQDFHEVKESLRSPHPRESPKASSKTHAALHESALASKLQAEKHNDNETSIPSKRSVLTDSTSLSQDKSYPKSHRRSDSVISLNSEVSEIPSDPCGGQADTVCSPDLAPGSGKSSKGSNPGDYGFVYSAERPTPPPEAGWTDKQGDDQKISLYSQNILKDGDTTEEVDRESIANLNTTKKQWEDIFTSQHSIQGEVSVKKKGAPKWEVKIPYTEKQSGVSLNSDVQISSDSKTSHGEAEETDMFKRNVISESAIEREIRLAHEREDILRKDKEDKMKQVEKQKGQGQAIIASYEAESESFHQVYNELAEADRGSDLWSGEHGRRHAGGDHESDSINESAHPNESIIEKEIRLQRERESEVSRMRQQAHAVSSQQQQHHQPQEKHQPSPVAHDTRHEEKDVNHNQSKAVLYEDSIAKNSHEGESLIARELRELKEREEELKRFRNSPSRSNNVDQVDGSSHANLPSQKIKSTSENSQRSPHLEVPSGQGGWTRDSSSQQRRESFDSTSSHGSGRAPSDSTPSRRDVKVKPIVDDHSDGDDDKKSDYFGKQETPIEKEIRLTRERENELRRQKGLPEMDQKDENPYSSYGASQAPNNNTVVSRPRSVGQPGESMKKFATNRLQQEMQHQKAREHELRSQGKVISTSEDHIEIKKYLEIAGVDRVDGTEKRNFVTRKAPSTNSESDSSLGPHEGEPAGGPVTRKMTSIASSGNMFSYKEFKQTAESKIEKELRELREREEELRLQRTNYHPESH